MAVDVSRIPNNNKFDPVREAILQLQTEIEDTGATIGNGTLTINTSGALTGSGTFTANQTGPTTITIGLDDSSYLTEEVNDLTAAVTWANVPDANITESSVTQHQAALSITESQISDLGNYLDLDNTGTQTISGSIIISEDLTVSGETTYINTNHLNIGDNIIQLNADIGGTTAPTEDAGFYVNRGSSPDASFLWDEGDDRFSTYANALATASLYIGANQVINSSRQFIGSSTISSTVPYFTFSGDSNTGVGRATNNKVSLIAEGTKALEASNTGVSITGDLEVGGTFTADGVTFPNDIITSADFSATDNRFKLTLTQADAGTIEASFDDVVLSESMAADYIPYVKVGGGDGDTTNAVLNDSFLKINGSTLELDWVIDGSPGVYTEHDLKMRKDGGGFGTYYEATYAADSVSFLHYASASDIDTAKIGATTTGRVRINDTYNLPAGDGTSGQVLSTNGSGDLSWVAAGGPTTSDLQDVTDNGATTTNSITVNGIKSNTYNSTGTGNYRKAFIDISSSSGSQKFKIHNNSNTTDGFAHFKVYRAYDYGANDQAYQEAIYQRRSTTKNLKWKIEGDYVTSDDVFLELYELADGTVETWLCVDDYAQVAVEMIYMVGTDSSFASPSSGTPTGTLIHSTDPDSYTPNWNIRVGNIQSDGFVKSGGTSSQFLKADGSIDSSSYALSSIDLDDVTTNGAATSNAITVGGLTGGNIQANGWLQAFSFLYTRDNLRVLNAAGTGWHTWATRSNGDYNLDVGTISSDDITVRQNIVSKSTNPLVLSANAGANIELYSDYAVIDADSTLSIRTQAASTRFQFNVPNGLFYVYNQGNAGGIDLRNANSRIYFHGNRAIEGATDGTNLQIGEGYSNVLVPSGATLEVDDNIVANNHIYMAKAGDPRIYAGSGVGLNIDGEQLYLNRYTSSNIAMVTGGGAVGIGTTSPAATLDVRGGINVGGSGQNANIWFQQNTNNQARINYYTDGNFYFDNHSGAYNFRTTSSFISRLFIENGGNVGIGTTSPSEKLEVNGNVKINSNTGVRINNYTSLGTTASGAMSILGHNVHVDSPNNRVVASNTGYYAQWIKMYYNQGISFHTSNTTVTSGVTMLDGTGANAYERMRITNAGNVGIGTDSPSYKLDVNGTARVQSNAQVNGDLTVLGATNGIYLDSIGHASVRIDRGSTGYDNNVLFMTAGNLDFRIWQDGSSDYLYVRDETGGGGNMVTFKKGGNVGIGSTDADSKLKVEASSGGSVYAGLRVGYAGVSANYYDADTHNIRNGGSTAQYVTINSTGVGIGITSPAAKLDVNGDVYVRNGNALYTDVLAGYSTGAISLNANTSFTVPSGTTYLGGLVRLTGTTSSTSQLDLPPTWGALRWYDGSTFKGGIGTASWSGLGSGNDLGFYLNTANFHIGNGSTPFVTFDRANQRVGIGTTSPTRKLHVSEAIGVNGSIGHPDPALNSGSAQWNKIGTFYTSQGGNNLKLEINCGQGYNANINQHSIVHVVFRTSNGSSNDNGFYGSCHWYVEGYSKEVTTIKVKQISASQYEFYGFFNNYYGNSFVKADCRLSDYWVSDPNPNSGEPTGTVITATETFKTKSVSRFGSAVYIDGSLGVGTTTPADKLDVNGNLSIYGNKIYNGAASNSAGLDFGGSYANLSGYYGIRFYSSTAGIGSMSERMRITNDGRIGINTTSPTNARMVINDAYGLCTGADGMLKIKSISTTYGSETVVLQTTIDGRTDDYSVSAYGGESRHILSLQPDGGRVGIRKSDPSYELDVAGNIRASGDVIAYSDARVKENVKTIDNALDKVTQLRGVSYNKIGETEEKIGVIAQEIEKVLPQVVQEDAEGMKSVAYGNIVGVLIESIKELKQEIDELKARLDGSTK